MINKKTTYAYYNLGINRNKFISIGGFKVADKNTCCGR